VFLHGLWILPLALLIVFLSSPRARGDIAETRVRRLLSGGLEKSRYTVINDLEVPTGAGSVHVDHLVVSRFGLFVIESVYARGWISGGEFQERWKRRYLARTDRMENPLHRNTLQAEAVSRLTGLPGSRMHPLVVMVGALGFKTALPDRVLLPEKLISHIRGKERMLLDDEQAARVLANIRAAGSAGRPARRQAGRRHLLLALSWTVMLTGLCLALHEPVANWWQARSTAWSGGDNPAAPRVEGDINTARELWEQTLNCAYSSDTGRCSCYDPEGTRAEVAPARCRELAERGSILRQ